MKLYIIGSLRNPTIPAVALALTAAGHEVFTDWFAPGPQADDFWQAYETSQGRGYFEAMNRPHAWHVFEYDKKWLDWADGVVLVLPAGKSAHIELGYTVGRGKPAYVLFPEEPERFDIMYRFASGIYASVEELVKGLEASAQ